MKRPDTSLMEEFQKYWDKRVKRGVSSRMSRLEMLAIELFFAWLSKRYKITRKT